MSAVAATRLAVVGLGGIGSAMAYRLLDAGFSLTVHNRTKEKATPVVAAGARLASSPAEAATADVVLLSLSDERAVEHVLFGAMLPYLRSGTVLVDTSTVSPTYARSAAARLDKREVRRVEACVIGNPQMARAGELRIFAAGRDEDVAAVHDVLAALARHGFRYLGPTGRASAMKLAFNLLLGAQTVALAEAVAFAEAAGLDRELLLTAIAKSGWRSPVLNFRAEFMRTRRYEPAGFRAKLMAKDLRLVVEEGAAWALALPLTEHAARRFEDAAGAGVGEKDAAVVVELPAGDRPALGRRCRGRSCQMTTYVADVTSPAGIVRLGTLFCESKAVLSAVELGVFTELQDGEVTEPELRRRLGLHPRGSRDFLNLLVALGLLDKDGNRYSNTPAANRYLVRGTSAYAGGFLEGASRKLWPAWDGLTEALRTGEAQAGGDFIEMLQVPQARRGYLAMMESLSGPLAPALAAAIDWTVYATVADVGGGRGNLLALLLKEHPHLTGWVFDLPPIEPDCREHVTALGVADRMRFRGGDFFTDPLPESDVLIVGHILADWAPNDRRTLIANAFRAVRPGGALLIYDPIQDPEHPETEELVASLHMLLMTAAGRGYTTEECRRWLEEVGFTVGAPRRIGVRDTLMIGRKPL